MIRRTQPFNFCLVDCESGVGRAFCSTGCLVSWLRWWTEPIGNRYKLGYPAKQIACQHCWICGNRTGYNGPCVLHDDNGCPERDWIGTCASTIMTPIVSQVLERPLDEHDFQVMEEVYDARQPDDQPWEVAMTAVDEIRDCG